MGTSYVTLVLLELMNFVLFNMHCIMQVIYTKGYVFYGF